MLEILKQILKHNCQNCFQLCITDVLCHSFINPNIALKSIDARVLPDLTAPIISIIVWLQYQSLYHIKIVDTG